MEVTIVSKERNTSGRKKEPIVVSQETWDKMQANGLANRFTVLSTVAANVNDVKNKKYIEEFTAKIKSSKTFKDYVDEYRMLKDSDKITAIKALKAAHEMSPKNKYVNNELKLYK